MKTRVIQDEPETDDHVINGQAPVVGASETEISAAPDVVWDVLSGIEAWPTWNLAKPVTVTPLPARTCLIVVFGSFTNACSVRTTSLK